MLDKIIERDKTKYYYQNDYASFNQYDKPLFFDCEQVHSWVQHYPNYSLQQRKCNLPSMYVITHWGYLSETWITKHICDLCLSNLMERYGMDNFIFEQ